MKKPTIWIAMLFAMVMVVPAAAKPIPSSTLSNNCAGCHGTYGRSTEPMPIIAGLSKAYFSRVMRQYQTGKRPSTIMGRLARGYSESELDDMAAFFASQIWKSPAQEVENAMVLKGEKIHEEKCEVCHKDGGRYQDDVTPRIAGQWLEYLEISLQEYSRSDRKMPHYFMTTISNTLSSKDITALAHFYANER
ncbi:MAG: cytochrome C [Pseudomonadota bacterium]